ncbi:sigma-70 family RNA polymerase sigma factor [Streptomyces sp. NPDC004232]|uniref:sigma-70 family RNA polymerase sigma factor n=1 Tax=Streptomyces sp. NPDC004232 TaxID=3154454 RepID=UPI001DDD38AD|nr:sigma-70 family RNA polymerase sigma factor [Streptomyces sp. tea 10]
MHSTHSPSIKALEDAVSVFTALRPRLLRIAYRTLGSRTEAEDVVQDAWLRWQNTDRARVLDPPAFLARTTAHLALNVAQSARSRHETDAGPGVPRTIDTSPDPLARAERAEALELALRLLLEKLSPTERAAYVLRIAFDYPYSQIAHSLQLSQVNTRQIVSRAHKRLFVERSKPVSTLEHRRLLTAFVAAAHSGNLAGLEHLLLTLTA